VTVRGEPIVVRELEERVLALSGAEARFLSRHHGCHLDLRPLPDTDGHWLLRPVNCCGVISLPGGRALFVEPKASIANLWRLVTGAWDLVELGEARVGMATAPDMLTYLAEVFVRGCDSICAQGLLRGYRTCTDDLSAVRGRIDIAGNLRRNVAFRHRLACRFDELTSDVPENRILLYALSRLASARSWRGEVRGMVHRCLAHMSPVTLTPATDADFAALRFTSMNRRYRTPLTLAQLLIRALGATHLPGSCELPPLLLDMPAVFERFVRGLLRDALLPMGLRVHHRSHSMALDDAGRVKLIPDVLVTRHGTPLCVVDAKYKLGVGADAAGPASADVYQMLAYCVGYGVRDAALVYPERVFAGGGGFATGSFHRMGGSGSPEPLRVSRDGTTLRIHTIGLDLSGDRASFDGECERLCSTIAALADAQGARTSAAKQETT